MTVYTDLTWKGFKNYPIFTTHTIKYIQGTMDINALIHQFAHLGDPKDFILKFIIVKLLSWSHILNGQTSQRETQISKRISKRDQS